MADAKVVHLGNL